MGYIVATKMHFINSAKLLTILSVFSMLPLDAWAGSEQEQVVKASWYGKRYAGRPTASGERFDPRALTAAHPSLPLGSLAEVRRKSDGRRVVVRINDRGPARGGGIDLSETAARMLGIITEGSALVVVTPVQQMAEQR